MKTILLLTFALLTSIQAYSAEDRAKVGIIVHHLELPLSQQQELQLMKNISRFLPRLKTFQMVRSYDGLSGIQPGSTNICLDFGRNDLNSTYFIDVIRRQFPSGANFLIRQGRCFTR